MLLPAISLGLKVLHQQKVEVGGFRHWAQTALKAH